MRQRSCTKSAGVSGRLTESGGRGRPGAWEWGGEEGLEAQTHLHPTSGQLWAQLDTNLVEDVEVPLTGCLTGHSSFLQEVRLDCSSGHLLGPGHKQVAIY